MPRASDIPPELLRDLWPVDDETIRSRYDAALEQLGVETPTRTRFHIDAAGFSPEIAHDRKDPHYLRHGVLHAHAIILDAAQLAAPLVHPSLGYASRAYRDVTKRSATQIASITRREPLIGEIRQSSTHFSSPEQMADLSKFEIHFKTPGGLVRGSRKLEAMKTEFLESSQRWLDDGFIAEMLDLAGRVREVGSLSESFVSSVHALGFFYSPAFGGTYVLEEQGASASSATTFVLTAEPSPTIATEYRSARGKRVRVETLDAASAVSAFEHHRIARIDSSFIREHGVIDRLLHWIAVSHLVAADPHADVGEWTPEDVRAKMRRESAPPDDYVEMEDVARRLAHGARRIDPESLSPLTRVRLMTSASARPDVARFVAHLKAFVDPVDLASAWEHAPDLFFARLLDQSPTMLRVFAQWLGRREVPMQ